MDEIEESEPKAMEKTDYKPGCGRATFTGPSFERREEIAQEACELFPSDPEMQRKYKCSKFWSEVLLCTVEILGKHSMPQ